MTLEELLKESPEALKAVQDAIAKANDGQEDKTKHALLMNTKMISKIQTIARLLGYRTETEEAFGKKVTSMDGVRFMDLKNYYTVSGSDVTANSCVKAGLSRNIGASSAAVTGLMCWKIMCHS